MFNHLKDEKSPYLRQHAQNPVEWYPWCAEAFEKAKKEDKPIFLSIGYSTCHWCHVMAKESFEDKDIAAILNQYFISIKVDREERPDIDSVYMTVCHAMHQSGGWPLTVLMDAQQRPFFTATYMPKRSINRVMGLYELLMQVSVLWDDNRIQLLKTGQQVVDYLKVQEHGEGNKSSLKTGFSIEKEEDALKEMLQMGAIQLLQSFDAQWGGFGKAPKFPMPHNLVFLLRYAELERLSGSNVFWKQNPQMSREEITEYAHYCVEKTLENMYRGGIFDHIGGGFSRYSTDDYWLVPHFEKMLYDNALLTIAYAEALQKTGNQQYCRIIHKILTYVLRELTSKEGAFYCGQDADSEGEEGKYYIFTPVEILRVLGEKDGEYFCEKMHINYELDVDGKCVPNRIQYSVGQGHGHCCHHHDGEGGHECCHHHDGEKEHECCHHHDGEEEHECCHHHDGEEGHECCHHHDGEEGHECCHHHDGEEGHECCHHHVIEERDLVDDLAQDTRLEVLCKKLYQYRMKRTYLQKDDKILTSWNSMMIAALAKAASICHEPTWLEAAKKAQNFVEMHLVNEQGRLMLRYHSGETAHLGQLDDYAYYTLALLELYQTTWEVVYLQKAVHIAEQMIDLFSDIEQGGFYMYAADAEQLISRPKETYDGAIPSGNSAASLALVKLAALTGEQKWSEARDQQLQFLANTIRQYPSGFCLALTALSGVVYPSQELICVTANERMPEEVRQLICENLLPNLTVLLKTPSNQQELAQAAPFTESYPIPEEGTVFYLCQNYACLAPVTDVKVLKEMLNL